MAAPALSADRIDGESGNGGGNPKGLGHDGQRRIHRQGAWNSGPVYEELEVIYEHLDSTTTVGAAAHGAQGNPPDLPSEWGQLMKTTHGGKTQVFERDFGNGQKVVTFVIWA